MPDQLAELLHQGRFNEAGRLMHTLKGLAATLGIQPLASAAADIERALSNAEAATSHDPLLEQLGVLVAASLRGISHVAAALQQTLPTAGVMPREDREPIAKELVEVQGLGEALDELAGLLRAADMRALEIFEQLQRTHPAFLKGAPQLDDAMASLDFDQALAHCQVLKTRCAK